MTETTAEVPSGIDDVTPQWLSAVLHAEVAGVRVEQIAQDSVLLAAHRLHLTGADRLPPTTPSCPPSPKRVAPWMLGGYRRELVFTECRRPRADGTPHVYARMVDGRPISSCWQDPQHWDNDAWPACR